MTTPASFLQSPIASLPSQELGDALSTVDLSLVTRSGAKGADMPAWAAAAGLPLPELSNRAVRHPAGGIVARLSPGEVLLLGDPLCADSSWITSAKAHLGRGQGLCFPLPRADSHAWFGVVGEHAPAMFAKVCSVDLRPQSFADLHIAQTSVARVNAIVIRDDQSFKDKCDFPCYHVLADWASARSLWDYLLDAMAEFSGRSATLEIQTE